MDFQPSKHRIKKENPFEIFHTFINYSTRGLPWTKEKSNPFIHFCSLKKQPRDFCSTAIEKYRMDRTSKTAMRTVRLLCIILTMASHFMKVVKSSACSHNRCYFFIA